MCTTKVKWYDLNEEFPNENEDVIVTNGEDVWVDNYAYIDGEVQWAIYPEGQPTYFAYMPDPHVPKGMNNMSFEEMHNTNNLMDIKGHLHERICDTEEGATNEMTWAEYIIYGIVNLNDVIHSRIVNHILFDATNEELNDLLKEVDYLLGK